MVKLEWNRVNGAKVVDKDAKAAASISFEKDDTNGFILNLFASDVDELEELTKAFALYYSYAQYYLQMKDASMLQHGLNDLEGKGYIIDADFSGLRLLPKANGNAEGITAQTASDNAYAEKISFLLTKIETDAQMNDILCSLGDAGGMAFLF